MACKFFNIALTIVEKPLPLLATGLAILFSILGAIMNAPGFGQEMDDQMDMGNHTTATNSSSANQSMTYDLTDSDIQLKLSWSPEPINTDQPTKFTFEFFDSNTGQPLTNVSYAVHMLLADNAVVHGHTGTAPQGIGTYEQQFDSIGPLVIIVESIRTGNDAVEGSAQFSINVVPEFPLTPVMIAGVVIGGLVVESRITKINIRK